MEKLFFAENDLLTLSVFPVGALQVNCTVICAKKSKHAIVFDPGDNLADINAILSQLKINKIEWLIHTHAHFDHIGLASNLKQKYQAQVALHEKDKELYANIAEQSNMFGLRLDPPTQVDSYLTETTILETPDPDLGDFLSRLKIIATPGHSPGSTCFFSEDFTSPLLIAGDTLFFHSVGRTDLFGGNYLQIVYSIKGKLFTLPGATQVICGHGLMTLISDEIVSNPFIR
ncbi:MAG: hypothetical protein A2504_03720 [Bdellovibrionales bacterium RIFOXYD12_FULL_39_22]|nr:MAG: hypothetical protein A2385_11470 [Bdellovibrionales bacterium RIFOXYB1_FULL_39_21]OFZ41685.1 MAG: hypothetical protein A2485_01780 [Bdellovibrionales bacterium RIFOXYC12_FULL_39_17]OFZ46085.1 MAG: hypothetical protein A2404_12145 [Bdellovibrionales bacterium RIFOXYC1_FULL_39_130]OFZ74912.1 MAG: hypothetical protein A2560_15185 [Bdellovibrionales bacterium RIFOXYD1_FULL_39_84]OFZ75145.1 MAG: hypothetical protein A2451_15250 [Bdellovibrionales bacterium RIFOXYC2_FULL_39_8]OFZ92765.1 MAG: